MLQFMGLQQLNTIQRYLSFFHLGNQIPCVCVQSLSHVQLLVTQSTVAYQIPFLHGIFQARILEWFAISYSRESSQLRDGACLSCVSCCGRQILYHSATWESATRSNMLQLKNPSATAKTWYIKKHIKAAYCSSARSVGDSQSCVMQRAVVFVFLFCFLVRKLMLPCLFCPQQVSYLELTSPPVPAHTPCKGTTKRAGNLFLLKQQLLLITGLLFCDKSVQIHKCLLLGH